MSEKKSVTITKSYFKKLYDEGKSMDEFISEITEVTGVKATATDVRKLAKDCGLNLRKKPRGTKTKIDKFLLIDDTTTTIGVNNTRNLVAIEEEN